MVDGHDDHDGIYLGNWRVAHIVDESGTTTPKEDFWGDFIGSLDDGRLVTISVIVYRLRIRTPDDVVRVVREMIDREENTITLKNYRHFASFCCTGKYLSIESKRPPSFFLPSPLMLEL